MSQEVIVFKALNGEEIIARLLEEVDGVVTIDKPRLLMAQPGQQPGQLTIGLAPWFLSSPDGTIEIREEHIFSRLKRCPVEMEKGYLEQTSGLDLSGAAPSGIVK